MVADSGLRISSRHYQKLVAKIEGKPEERILSYLMLRSLKQARYSTENVGHFALAAPTYTHFTSPIRRYPDLMVHRLLRAVLTGNRLPAKTDLQPMADECSQSERRAADAERELVEWKKVKFMTERVGQDFDALIISTAKYGLFVELTDLFIEGLVPIDTLPGDQYTYQENVRKIVGKRTRREFSIGDRVRVRAGPRGPNERKLQFSILEDEPKRSGSIPGGEFLMGRKTVAMRSARRTCQVSPFRLSCYQVTNVDFAEFRKVEFADPEPVTSVNWFDAVEYCDWLSAQWNCRSACPPRPSGNLPLAGASRRSSIPGATRFPRRMPPLAHGPEPVAHGRTKRLRPVRHVPERSRVVQRLVRSGLLCCLSGSGPARSGAWIRRASQRRRLAASYQILPMRRAQ